MAMDIAGMLHRRRTRSCTAGCRPRARDADSVRARLALLPRRAATSLRHLNPNMDVLIALGTSVAYVYSAWVVIADKPYQMFFDVSAAVLVFITMGKYFEERSKGAASSAIQKLLGMSAKSARVIRDGVEVEIAGRTASRPATSSSSGPARRSPVDGVVREGAQHDR